MSRPNGTERLLQTRRLMRSEGVSGVTSRLLTRAAKALNPPGYGTVPIDRKHLLRAAEIARGGWQLPEPLPWDPAEPMRVAWVCGPSSEGSGGHTTMFRMVDALQRAGHECVVYVHDLHQGEHAAHRRTIRSWWPWMGAEVRDYADGVADAHAIFATSWQSAYPVLASPARGVRLYFVQDLEPAFYPAGSEALLAEATYRFGFHGVTAGRWLAEVMQRDYDMSADHFDFGCDSDHYGLDRSVDPGARTDVCYYCRPSTPRRAHQLAVLALDLFATRHPDVGIHAFGEPAGRLPFAATDHGLLEPAQLSALYNRCVAGLVISATNVSLVPHEMLAAGCIPVVNDAEHNRIVLESDEVAYALATPFDLADALSRLVERTLPERRARAEAAASVTLSSWESAGAQVEEIVRRVVTAQSAARPVVAMGP